jgi:hypothetical protein
MVKAGIAFTRPEPILALAKRLRAHATQNRRPSAADLRLAAAFCTRLAALMIAEESRTEKDPALARQLRDEACELWRDARQEGGQ